MAHRRRHRAPTRVRATGPPCGAVGSVGRGHAPGGRTGTAEQRRSAMAATIPLTMLQHRRHGRGLAVTLACLLALGGLLGGPVGPAGAAACTVTNTNNAGGGSLRAAIANTDGFAN